LKAKRKMIDSAVLKLLFVNSPFWWVADYGVVKRGYWELMRFILPIAGELASVLFGFRCFGSGASTRLLRARWMSICDGGSPLRSSPFYGARFLAIRGADCVRKARTRIS